MSVVFHADRGSQFTSVELAEVAHRCGVKISMGRTGVCWDNAMLRGALVEFEDFSAHHCVCTPAGPRLQADIRAWTHWFNNERKHSSVGYVCPVQFELSKWSTDAVFETGVVAA